MLRRLTGWVAGLGLVMATLGIGFTADADPPFVHTGVILCVIGVTCYLLAGWVAFGRRRRW